MVLVSSACSQGHQTSLGGLGPARTVFLATPNLVQRVVDEVAAEFPNHPPTPRLTPLLLAAVKAGFSTNVFDRALAAMPAPTTSPDTSTVVALRRLALAESRIPADAAMTPADTRSNQAAAVAATLPAMAAAKEEGLALDRINLLVEAARNAPDVVHALAPSVLASQDGGILMYSRDNVVQEDRVWGGHRATNIAQAQTRESNALRALAPNDFAAVERWYASAGGRSEVARTSALLAQAYDAAAATMTKKYFKRL